MRAQGSIPRAFLAAILLLLTPCAAAALLSPDGAFLTSVLKPRFYQTWWFLALCSAAPGSAPKGLGSTGDPGFCTLWTLCGMPAVTLPLMQDSGGLPIGVQLVGRRNFDARLLRTARWLADRVQAQA